MRSVVVFSAEIGALVLAVAACYVLLLLYRNPHRPKWLDRELASSTFAIGGLCVLILALAWFVKSLVSAGLDPLAAMAIAGASLAATAVILWKAMAMRRRLAEADMGRSPFALRGRGARGGGLAGQA